MSDDLGHEIDMSIKLYENILKAIENNKDIFPETSLSHRTILIAFGMLYTYMGTLLGFNKKELTEVVLVLIDEYEEVPNSNSTLH